MPINKVLLAYVKSFGNILKEQMNIIVPGTCLRANSLTKEKGIRGDICVSIMVHHLLYNIQSFDFCTSIKSGKQTVSLL